jgi:hypothetical protein
MVCTLVPVFFAKLPIVSIYASIKRTVVVDFMGRFDNDDVAFTCM